MIIAVDFDGTLLQEEGLDYKLLRACRRARERGYKLILWTCRFGEELEEAVSLCAALGLTFDAVNDNLRSVKEDYGNPRKIVADLYIDDRASNLDRALLVLQRLPTVAVIM